MASDWYNIYYNTLDDECSNFWWVDLYAPRKDDFKWVKGYYFTKQKPVDPTKEQWQDVSMKTLLIAGTTALVYYGICLAYMLSHVSTDVVAMALWGWIGAPLAFLVNTVL